MLGYEAPSKLLSATLGPDVFRQPADFQRLIELLRSSGEFKDVEVEWKRKDGTPITVRCSGRSLDEDRDASPCFEVFAEDVTERRVLERQLRMAAKMEAIGRLAGGVAHDFNNVLGIISACAEFLRDRIDPAAEPSLYVENIKKAIERGQSLTKQMLAFSRTSAIQPRVLDLNERLRDISKLLRPLLGDDVEVLIVPRSPSAVIEADPGQLDQIVVNLAVNARDAMPRGGKFILETGIVKFGGTFAEQQKAIPPGKYVMLAVSDTGSGMDEATMSRIFEPFFTTKGVGEGTGLGLDTVQRIVKKHKGSIQVSSKPGDTRFQVWLPLAGA